MSTNATNYQVIIQQKIKEIEQQFEQFKQEIYILNKDFSDISDRVKIIDQLIALDRSFGGANILLSGALLDYEIKTHLIVLMGNLTRIYKLLKNRMPSSN